MQRSFSLRRPTATELLGASSSSSSLTRSSQAPAPRHRRAAATTTRALLKVRPYTVSSTDTLESIAAKRDIPVEDLMTLNAARLSGRRSVEPGQKIVLPAGKLSARDREILAGIEPGSRQGRGFRPYPVRKGETAADIASKRKISMAELQKLNPDVNLEKVKADQVIKLPANKFSVREREMLTGTLGIPAEFFSAPAGPTTVGVVLGGAVLAVAAAVAALLFQKRNRGDN